MSNLFIAIFYFCNTVTRQGNLDIRRYINAFLIYSKHRVVFVYVLYIVSMFSLFQGKPVVTLHTTSQLTSAARERFNTEDEIALGTTVVVMLLST